MRRVLSVLFAAGLLACSDAEPGGPSEETPAGPTEPYRVVAFAGTPISSLSEHPNFQRARAKVDLGSGPFERATLVVELESPCYPFSKWKEAGAIPSGHRWPAICDAFDRTFSFHFLPRAQGQPALELVRAITPFGGPMTFEVDVTDVANGLPGAHELEAFIGTWPDPAGQVSGARGAWFLSARFDLVPGEAPREVLAVVPLFSENWDGASAQRVFAYELEIPEGASQARIEYRATGHGPVEEFSRRTHRIHAGQETIFEGDPWVACEDNCDVVEDDPDAPFAYCAQNPCADHRSARAPRANWCPGQLVPPIVIDDPLLLRAGAQTLAWRLDSIAGDGLWTSSATYFAFK